MSSPLLIGAERGLQDAVLAALKEHSQIEEIFGSKPRILDDLGGAKPAYPYLVIGRHEVRPANASGVSIRDHVMDLQVITRWSGRAGARDAVSLVQSILDDADLVLQGHNLVWCYIAFADSLMLRDQQTFKSVVRIKARTTPLD